MIRSQTKTILSTLLIIASVIIICVVTLVVNSQTKKQVNTSTVSKPVDYGIIDPKNTHISDAKIKFESVFWSWENNPEVLSQNIDTIISRKRTPIIFIEPTLFLGKSNYIFNKIIEGNYDTTISQICKEIGSKNIDNIISFAPYMDLSDSSKEYANSDGFGYTNAYKYFTEKCNKLTKQTKYLWTVDGINDVSLFYPKNNVDYIGLSVVSVESEKMTFKDIYDPKYNQVKNYKKPIIITQLGVSGSTQYQNKWITDAKLRIIDENLQRYTQIVVYNQGVDTSGKIYLNNNQPDFTFNGSIFPFN